MYLTSAPKEIEYDSLRLSSERIADNEVSIINFLSKGKIVGKMSVSALSTSFTSDGVQIRTLVNEECEIEFPEKKGTVKSSPIPKWEWTAAQKGYAEKFGKDTLYRVVFSISSKEIKILK